MKKGRPKKMSGHVIDITGQEFGYLTIIRFIDTKSRGGTTVSFWECKCKCGNSIEKSLGYLKRTNRGIHSCGCREKEDYFKIFESNFKKVEGCWIWEGYIGSKGYGKFGANTQAHRRSYLYYVGEIPPGKQVCHTCDNRKCVNPAHFFLGSIGDNMRDRTKKNRQAKGSKIANSILTENQVLDIRKDRLSGIGYQQISEKYAISWYLVRSICKNRQWKHVPLGEECKNFKSSLDYNQIQHQKLE